MIRKIQDHSKIILNAQDVMLNVKVKLGDIAKTTIDLSAMNKKDREELQSKGVEILSIEVLAVGSDSIFSVGQLVELKSNNSLKTVYEPLNDEDTQRVYVIHMNNVAYAVESENIK